MADMKSKDGEKNMQAAFDKEQEQGFRGGKTDPTPNEAYTVQGVTSNPEQAADAARNATAIATEAAKEGN